MHQKNKTESTHLLEKPYRCLGEISIQNNKKSVFTHLHLHELQFGVILMPKTQVFKYDIQFSIYNDSCLMFYTEFQLATRFDIGIHLYMYTT